jgi:hypothetical protein
MLGFRGRGEIGRRNRFRSCRWKHCGGSIPLGRTNLFQWVLVFADSSNTLRCIGLESRALVPHLLFNQLKLWQLN